MAPRRSGKGQSSLMSPAHDSQTKSDAEPSKTETGQETGNIYKIEPWGKSALATFTRLVVDALDVYNEQWGATALAQCAEDDQDECRDRVEELCDVMSWQLEGKRDSDAVVRARRDFRDWEWRIVRGLRFGGDPAKVGKALMESIEYEESKRRRSRRVVGLAPSLVLRDPVKLRPDDYIIDSLLVIWEGLSLRVNGSVDETKCADPFAILE